MSEPAELGLGTHRVRGDLERLILQSIDNGISHIDTAPNYQDGMPQRTIGTILRAASPTCLVSTKVGFIPRSASAAALRDGVISESEYNTGHSLNSRYIRWQVERNIEDLGGTPLQLLFLHNPEQLLHPTSSGFLDLLVASIRECENLRERGLLLNYGISTWRGLWAHCNPVILHALVRDCAGEYNGFSALQLPVSLVRCDELYEALRFRRGVLVDAKGLRWKIYASSPLHGGELLKLGSEGVIRALAAQHQSDGQTLVNCVRSSGFVDVVLFSTSDRSHLEEALQLREKPLIDRQLLLSVLSRILGR